MRKSVAAFFVLAVIGASPPMRAEEAPVVTLTSSEPLYAEILTALTPVVEEAVGLELRLDVSDMKRQGDFAFVAADTLNRDGNAVDFSRSSYAEIVAMGDFDGPHLWAYLQLIDGRWIVLEQDIGPTDAYFAYWPKNHGGSCTLTGLGPDC